MGLIGGIAGIFHAIFQFFRDYFNVIDIVENRVQTIITKGEALVLNARKEFQAFNDFKFDPRWNQRVILVPKAIQKTRDFLVGDGSAAVDLIKHFERLINDLKGLWKTRTVGVGGGGLTGVEKGTGIVMDTVRTVDHTFTFVEQFVDNLQSVVDDVRAIRTEIEKLDTIFLQQGNPRVRVTKTISQRDRQLNLS